MKQEQNLHYIFTDAFRAERKLWGQRLAAIGVTQGQPKMLNYIYKNDGCIQKDIAEGTGIEPPSATSILAVMERDGLVRREQSADDRRRSHVYITDKGKEKREQILEIAQDVSDKILVAFTEEEKELLFTLLEKMIDSAKNIAEQSKN